MQCAVRSRPKWPNPSVGEIDGRFFAVIWNWLDGTVRKKRNTVCYSTKQIKSKIARGEDRTNWAKVHALTRNKLEASIRVQTDDIWGEPYWRRAVVGVPSPKTTLTSKKITTFCNGLSPREKDQTHMNDILRVFVQTRRQHQDTKSK